MNLPMLVLSSLPDLGTLTAAFGSLFQPGQAGGADDDAVIMMVFVYEQTMQP